MSLENLIGNLMAYEVQLEDRKKDEQSQSKKKVLAFHTSSYMDNSDDDEEEMAMLQGKFKKNKDTNDNPICFKCNKSGHIKKDCPLLKYKGNFKFANTTKRRKIIRQLGRIKIHLPLTKKPLKLPMFVLWHKKMRYKNILNY